MERDQNPQDGGIVRGIAYRPKKGDPIIETTNCRVQAGRGLDAEERPPGRRGITLLSAEAWSDACREVGAVVPWHARRANLLVEGLDVFAAVGRTLAVGDVRIKVHEESTPCDVLDEVCSGLREALAPNGRAGVAGEVLAGGTIHIGDRVAIGPS